MWVTAIVSTSTGRSMNETCSSAEHDDAKSDADAHQEPAEHRAHEQRRASARAAQLMRRGGDEEVERDQHEPDRRADGAVDAAEQAARRAITTGATSSAWRARSIGDLASRDHGDPGPPLAPCPRLLLFVLAPLRPGTR